MSASNLQNCLACGAPLDAPVQGGKIRCSYCRTANLVKAHEKVHGDDILCPECGAANPKAAKHCGRCGIKLEFNCPKCGAVNAYGTVFCVQCGIDVPAEIKRQKEEILRQEQEQRRQEEETRRRFEEQQKKTARKTRNTLLVLGGLVGLIVLCFLGMIGIGAWQMNTPAGKSTQTAVAVQATSTKQVFLSARTATAASKVLFEDDFSDPASGWEDRNLYGGSVGYGDGYYFVKATEKGNNLSGTLNVDNIPNVIIRVNASQISGPVNNNTAFGVICRLQNDGSQDGYYFRISGTGYFSVIRRTGDILSSLVPGDTWNASPSISKAGDINSIMVTCEGDTLSFTVNGTTLFEGNDTAFTSGGVALLGAVYEDNASAEFHYTNFSAREP